MILFIARRLLFILAVAAAIIFAVHLGTLSARTPSQRSAAEWAQLSRIAYRQSSDYLARALRGDLGQIPSRRGPIPVRTVLADTYGKSMGLLAAAFGLAVLAGIPAGTLSALARRYPLAFPLLLLTVLGISTPSFFAALLLQVAEIQWVKTFGYPLVSVGGFGWDLEHMLLPGLVLAARPVAYLTRATFLSLSRVMTEDYVRTAWAKGLGLPGILGGHALRNMAIPTLTAMAVSLRFALGSLPVVEFFFGWPGMGDRLLSAIQGGQTEVVAALALALGMTFMLINLLLEILYRFIDPRLRQEAAPA